MKKLKFISILFLFIISAKVSGDILISADPARIYVRIKNLDDYPNIAVIGRVCNCWTKSKERAKENGYAYGTYPTFGKAIQRTTNETWNDAYLVKQDSCLKIPLNCPLVLYAVKKEYIENKDLEKIDWENDKNAIESNLTLKSNTFFNNERIISIEMDFNIAGFSDTSMVLYKSKQINKYNSGRSDFVEYFSYKGDLSKLHKDIN